jgi:hypothetical protein
MWDRQTQSWWQQFEGQAIVGSLTGTRNPYAGYDTVPVSRPFDYGGRLDPRLPPVERVDSRSVGSAAAFDRRLASRTLDFRPAGIGVMSDLQTGSSWDITGRATAGPLRGSQLRRLRDLNAFWVAVAAFLPHARLLAVGSAA